MIARSAAFALCAAALAGPALAAPSEAQKAEFYSVCVGISSDAELCTCKADAAMELIDERFMGVVISSMRGRSLAASDAEAYGTYIGRSNQICKPDY